MTNVYFFAEGQAEGGSEILHLVGGKGASLGDMTRAGLNVPPGFTISAECCDLYFKAGRQWPAGLDEEVRANLARLEGVAGRAFGRGDDPLLVAVRSGSARSMPGMMDTVLNVGLNPDCVRAIAERASGFIPEARRAAWEAYRHFLGMFGHTIGGIPEEVFTGLIADLLQESGKRTESELDAAEMERLCDRFRAAYRQHAGRDLPTDPWELLRLAIDAVFDSWNNERAVIYRRHHQIEGLLGTAVTVQAMCPAEVSGILFTAHPVNPELEQMLIESSFGLGEAIVLGKVTPDRFVLDKRSLREVERSIAVKEHVTAAGNRRGDPAARRRVAHRCPGRGTRTPWPARGGVFPEAVRHRVGAIAGQVLPPPSPRHQAVGVPASAG
jgi:pyruvate,orthophosphate dikinase